MKKMCIAIATVILILCLNKKEQVIIPKESIRFRVVANSDLKEDQDLKKQIVKSLNSEIYKLTINAHSLEEVRNRIVKGLPEVENKINNTISTQELQRNVTINYGNNYFPRKEYKGIIYEEGNYESLVIIIGDGLGKNFWCVLFPPLCNIDENSDYEYTTLVQEIINKYKK